MFSKKLSNFFGVIILIISSILILGMIASSSQVFFSTQQAKATKIILLIITALIIFIIVFFSIKINRYNTRLYFIILISLSVIEYLIWNLYASTVPVSDYKVLFEGAEKMVSGSFPSESFDKTNYFYFYNFQTGYTSYLALVMKIFGKNLFWFKLLDASYMTLNSIVIYKIVEKISTKDSASAAGMIHATFIPLILGSSVINNQHLSSLLMILAIYFILNKKIIFSIIAGSLLGFTQIFRPVSIIVLIATFIYYFCVALRDDQYKQYIIKFMFIIIFFSFIVNGFDYLLMHKGLVPSPISKGNAKYFKFVLGIKGNGVYNIPTENARRTQVFYDLQTLNFDYDKYNEVCLDVLKNSIKDYRHTALFIKNKMFHFLGDKDNQYQFSLSGKGVNCLVEMFKDIGHLQYIFITFFSLISLLIMMIKKKNPIDIFNILIVGFILVHIFIETQPRYRYETYIFLMITSSQVVNYFTTNNLTIKKV